VSWAASKRLGAWADKVRAIGWINLLLSIALAVWHTSEHPHPLALGALWGAAGMIVTHVMARLIDKHAERVTLR
jgi:hypothetical protein